MRAAGVPPASAALVAGGSGAAPPLPVAFPFPSPARSGRAFRHDPMGPLDALDHLVNFLLPAVGVGAIAAALAKLLWRGALRGVPWRSLAGWAMAAAAAASVAGLAFVGRDGAMATYAAMVAAVAAALLWRGFLRGAPR